MKQQETMPLMNGIIKYQLVIQPCKLMKDCRILYVKHGTGMLCMHKQKVHLEAGQLILAPSLDGRIFPETQLSIIQIILSDYHITSGHNRHQVLHIQAQKDLCSILSLLEQEDASQYEYTQCFSSLLHILIIQISRITHQTYRFTPIKEYPKEILIIKQYMNDHWKETISIDALASLVSMQKHALLHLYKRECGVTMYEEFTQIKLDHACEYLKTTALSIDEIAIQCGFSSPSYFIQVFHKHLQDTPLQYRKAYKRELSHKKRQALHV